MAFWKISDTARELFCDLWRPTNGDVTGLAFVFLHGRAWYMGDKDFFSRPFFRHLVAQGHTLMDVACCLCPEVDINDMIGDIKRAISWMKANAPRYGVDLGKIVIAGGSAGGHLALLAGYVPHHSELAPERLSFFFYVFLNILVVNPDILVAMSIHGNAASSQEALSPQPSATD